MYKNGKKVKNSKKIGSKLTRFRVAAAANYGKKWLKLGKNGQKLPKIGYKLTCFRVAAADN